MSGYAQGGYIPTPHGQTIAIFVDDDECVLNRQGMCVREDERHHRDAMPIMTWVDARPVAHSFGPCHHRACHLEPVESVVDGGDGRAPVSTLRRAVARLRG